MYKIYLTLISILILTLANLHIGIAQQTLTEIYKRVEIVIEQPADMIKIQRIGIDLICGSDVRTKENKQTLTLELSESEIQRIDKSGFQYDIVIDDLSKFYAERASRDLPKAKEALRKAKIETKNYKSQVGQDMSCNPPLYPVPQNFNLGSMGGFTTYQEMLDDLDKMALLYPNLITVKASASTSGLTTIQGRPVYYVKISDNPNVNENEPELFYNGVHHAREPLSMMNLLYYMWYLLENYNTDLTVKNILDNTELYFIPVVNPDGYIQNETTNPAGGGLWRKNMRDNGDGTFGVDPNRNYGFNWGYDNTGSSPFTGDQTYRGTGPFSESENQIIKEFSENHSFVNVFNNHSYGNLMIHPWGYDNVVNPDYLLLEELSEQMCWHNRYYYGGSEVLYSVNGDANDWQYGEQITKNKALAWTPEIGGLNEGGVLVSGGYEGFWPSPIYIRNQCERHLYMSLLIAEAASNHGIFNDLTPYGLSSLNPTLDLNMQHMSLTPGNFTINVTSSDPNVINIATPVLSTGVLTDTNNQTISTGITLSPSTPANAMITFNIVVNNGTYNLYTTDITKQYNPSAVFTDACNNLSNWTTSSWGIDNTTGYNVNGSISDSPSGSSISGDQYITLTNPINTTFIPNPILEYYTKWDIAKLQSYAQIEVSTNGITWTELCGNYTKRGVNVQDYTSDPQYSIQPAYEAIYDGYQENFVREQIDLGQYSGVATLYIRFRFNGNQFFQQGDGIWIDDITVYNGRPGCEPIIIENTSSLISMSQSAIDIIETDGSVAPGSAIIYNAGDYVQLNPGFCTVSNSTFMAIIRACQ